MTTVPPVKYKSRAATTRPAFGARTGVPVPLRKSVPACGLRACPLYTLRVPKALLACSSTGRTKAPVHKRWDAGFV
jgi:hypothetical protein